ncbi:MAG: molybdopterin-dependent oxidoreductase [Candidatus Methylomirabilia bacterium]
MDRRQFFQIVASSAAAAGCGRSTEQILPYVIPPENLVPGVASWFSTVCRECPAGCGVIARNRDGRSVKLEGNPDHPVNRGTLCIRGQSGLQSLYNPDRIRGPLVRDSAGNLEPRAWEEAEKRLAEKLLGLIQAGRGNKVAVLSHLETGSLGRLTDRWAQALGLRSRVSYEPFAYEAIRTANRLTFGRNAIPEYAFDSARLLLSFGADFLETWLSPAAYAGAFARMHTLRHGEAGTFIHVEPRLSLTAANADEWVRNAPGTEGMLALAMLRVIVDEGLQARGVDAGALRAAVKGVELEAVAAASEVSVEAIRQIARRMATARPSLAVGGGVAVSGRNAAHTQVAINLLNYAVGNLGKTVRFGPDSALGKVSPYRDVLGLTQAMARGEVEVLLLIHVNPLFTLPTSAKFAEALAKVPLVVSFANQLDETTATAHLVFPDLHWLEAWGDFSPREGVHGLIQPTMATVPGYEARAVGDVLLAVGKAVLGSPALPWGSFQEYLKERWKALARTVAPGMPFETFWEESLRRGGVWKSVPAAPVRLRARVVRVAAEAPKLDGRSEDLALLACPSLRFYDGRGANKSWLQEAPDSMTQASWDSWVEVPAEKARALGVVEGDVVAVTSRQGSVELPAVLSQSLHPGAVAIPIGQGHTAYGRYAKGRGANPISLLASAPETLSGGLPWLSVRVMLTKTGRRQPLASPQATSDQDHREVAQHIDLAAARELELRGRPPEHANLPSMYPNVVYPEHRWGMAIDLDSCIGCQACVVACQAENNVPVVGQAEVAYGRIMHWIRVERWWEGAPSHPTTLFLPMLCQQCDVAPCEPVCPVFASYHTKEGLNAQVYNRCVGTRYCNNNCPYHVRKFNFAKYPFPDPLPFQLNPDVTARQAGVMEKCTFCVQRIMAGKDRAKDERRTVKDGDIVPACQQTCPTQAIVFGDLKDPGSRASELARSARGYHVLGELGTRSAITYLKKVTREPHATEVKGG